MEDQERIVATAEEYAASSQSKTAALARWISSVRSKAGRARRQRRGDLRTVAILGVALRRAEDELVRKQRARALRWSALQARLARPPPPPDSCWREQLESLDNFFNDLNNVRVPEAVR